MMLTMSTSPSTYHHGDLRETLMRAAERLIDADVSRSFSLREIAREAGVSHAAPYKHFDERRDLVLALAARWMSAFVAEQERASGTLEARASLLAIGHAYVRYAHTHPSRFQTIFDPSINRPDAPVTPAFGESVHRHTTLLREAVRRAAHAGVFASGEPAAVEAALWSQVHGLATLVMLGFIPFGQTGLVLSALLPDAAESPARM